MTDAAAIQAGSAYVEVFARNEKLERGLQEGTRKLATWAASSRQIVSAAVSTGGAAIAAGVAGAAIVGRGLGATMTAVGNAFKAGGELGSRGYRDLANVIQKLTPLSTRLWDVTQGGMGRGVRMLGTLRALLVAAGDSAKPLLAAFDGLARKSASVAWWSRAGAALRLDFKGAAAYSTALRAAREGYLSQRSGMGGVGSWLNIRGGYALTGALSLGLRTTGRFLTGIATTGARSARAIAAVGTAAAATAGLVRPLNTSLSATEGRLGRLARLMPRFSSMTSILRGGALRAAGVGALVLGTLTSAAGVSGSLTNLFSSQGFAKHAVAMDDAARKRGVSVETYSGYESAAQMAGTTLDDAAKDPGKMAQVEAARRRAMSLGGFVTSSQVALAREANQATGEMGVAFRAVGTAIGSAVLPQIIQGVRWVTSIAVAVAQFAQENPRLIQQLYSVGRAFAIGATAAAAIAAGIGLITSPVGLVAVALGALAALFPTLWQSAKENFGAITATVEEVGSFFHSVFGGIIDALSAGNLQLAADVAWAGLMVSFETGIDFLNRQWVSWTTSLASAIDEGLTTARIKLDQWFPGFEEGFSSTLGFLQDAWTITVNTFLDVWDQGFAILKKSINFLRSLFDSTFDINSANKAIDQQFEKKVAARADAQADLIGKRDQERRKRSQDLATYGTEATLRKEQRQREIERAAANFTAGMGSDRLRKARAQLDLALKSAATARKEKDAEREKKVDQGALNTKLGVATRESRGAAANDVRTKEGLADVLVAFRGGRKEAGIPDIAKTSREQLREAQTARVERYRTRLSIERIDRNLENLDAPIS